MAPPARSLLKVLFLLGFCVNFTCGFRQKARTALGEPASKKRFLFCALGGTHCTPQLDIARVLLEQGHEVSFLTIDEPFVADFGLTREYPDTFHVVENKVLTEGYDPDVHPNITKYMFSYVGEEPRDIPSPGDILWEVAAYKKWQFFTDVAENVKPDAIVFDVVTDGFGKFLAKEIGVPSFGSIPIPISQPQSHADRWQEKAPPGDLRKKAAKHLTRMWREKGWIKGKDLDLTGADLVYPDYTFSYSSPILEKDAYLKMKDNNLINGDFIFVGRDYTYDLEKAPVSDDDQKFLNEIDKLRGRGDGLQKQVAFLSLGTQAKQPAYFNDYVMEALGDQPYTVVLQLCSTPRMTEDEARRRLESAEAKKPKNFIVFCALKSHAVVMRVLKKADLFLSHVGRNTMMEAVSQGVPLITLPVQGDQYDNSDIILEEGLGKTVPSMKDGLVTHGTWQLPTPQKKAAFIKELQKVVGKVIYDLKIKEVVANKKTLASGHGLKVAADIILGNVKAADFVTDPETLRYRSFSTHACGGYVRVLAVAIMTSLCSLPNVFP